jgi:hypothetical protein
VDGYDDDVDDEKPMATPKVKRAPFVFAEAKEDIKSSTDEHEVRTSSTVLSELNCVDGYDDDVDDEKPTATHKVKSLFCRC